MSLKSRVEAVLFLTDKPTPAAAVAKLVNEDVQLVRQAILELIHDYEERNCALEIADDDDGYMMQVKDEYANLANDLAPIELPLAVVRTLSAVAIKQPVMQSEIVRIRGAGAYEHVKELLEKELINKKEDGGRSPMLSTTKKFQEYFRLSHDAKSLRNQLREQDKEEKQAEHDQQLELHLEGEQTLQPREGQIIEIPTLIAPDEIARDQETSVEAQLNETETPMQQQIIETEETQIAGDNVERTDEISNEVGPEAVVEAAESVETVLEATEATVEAITEVSTQTEEDISVSSEETNNKISTENEQTIDVTPPKAKTKAKASKSKSKTKTNGDSGDVPIVENGFMAAPIIN